MATVVMMGVNFSFHAQAGEATRVKIPAPSVIPDDKALVLVGPGVRSVIIKADSPKDYYFPFDSYRFPYTGGDTHFKRYADYITGMNVPVMSCKDFEVENRKTPFDTRIWVGLQPKTREVMSEELKRLDDDGFAIKVVGKDVYITGKNIWGTEWAVYDILEKFARCRWYAPGPDWYREKEDGVTGLFHIIPKASSVRIPADLNILENPSYKMRWMMCDAVQEFRLRYRDKFHHNLINPFIPSFPSSLQMPDVETAKDPTRRAAYYVDSYNKFFGDYVKVDPPPAPTDDGTIKDAGKFANYYAEYYRKQYPQFYDKWSQAHLDYFPEINGKRTPPNIANTSDFQPCIGSPKVFEALVKAASEAFQAGEGTYSIGMNDSNKYCECTLCQAMVPDELKNKMPDKNQRIAYSFFVFYNKLAEKLSSKFPDKRLGCLAYAVLSSLPPGLVKLHPMIVPYLTRDSAQLFDRNEVGEFAELVERWGKMSYQMGIYEYVYGAGFVIPRLYNRYILKNIAERYNIGVDGFYGESSPNWALDGIKYWMISKMLWNNKLDPKELERDYLENCFGPVAGTMQKYFDFLEEAWCTQEEVGIKGTRSNYRWMNDSTQLGIFTPEKCDKAWALLEEAEKTIAKYQAIEMDIEKKEYCSMVARRLDFLKKGFNVSRTLACMYDVGKRLEPMLEQKDLNLGEALQPLSLVFRSPTIRKVYEDISSVKEVGIVPLAAALGDYNSFCSNYGSYPGINKMIHRITVETVEEALKDCGHDPVKTRRDIDGIIKRRAGEKVKDKEALSRLTEIVKSTGMLVARHTDITPLIDGKINSVEWGEPAYAGNFYKAFSLTLDSNRTTIWAMEDGQKLYLAFDCESDPDVMGADVRPGEADPGPYPKKSRDDAISLSLGFQRNMPGLKNIIVNLNGACSMDSIDVKTSRGSKGWQVEMALSMKELNLDKKKEPTPFGVSRYTRVKKPDSKNPSAFETVCSTLMPVADVGGNVGNGNHVQCMTFIWGPLLIYQAHDPETKGKL